MLTPPYAITDAVGAAADPLADPPERAELRAMLRSLIDQVSPADRIASLDEEERFDDRLHAALAEVGVLGIGAGDGDGGGDLGDQLVVVEELAAGPTSMAAFLIGHYAVVTALRRFGNGPVQLGVLEELAAGRTKVAFALSEADGGTDVARVMRTRADAVAGGYELHGRKMWTSGAARADWIVVMARTSPIVGSAADGVSMFLVPAAAPGIEINEIATLGIRGMSTCEILFDGVELGEDSVLGTIDRGMRQAFASVNREGLLAAAASLGVGRAALALALGHARQREVFGKPIGALQVPQHWLVDAAVALEAARGLMGRAAAVELAGGDASSLAAMAKLLASEAASDISLRGMQLMGGLGYTREVAMQRLFRDGRLWSFSPLNNEMVRNGIGQRLLGLPRSY